MYVDSCRCRIHLHWLDCSVLFTFHIVLCRYPIALGGSGMLPVIPGCYLDSTVAKSKITDCPSDAGPFYSRTGHVSFPRLFTQSAWVIASYTLHSAQHLLLIWVYLSDLQIWDWLVQCENLRTSKTHHH